MGILDIFRDKKPPKRASPRDRRERLDDDLRRAKLAAGREVLRAAQAEAERQNNDKTRLRVTLIKEARFQLSQGDDTGAASTLTKAMGKRWGDKLRNATRARKSRTPKKSAATLEREAKAAAEKAKKAKALEAAKAKAKA